jgi:hypothetical protein
MRRYLLVVLLWAGVAAPSFAYWSWTCGSSSAPQFGSVAAACSYVSCTLQQGGGSYAMLFQPGNGWIEFYNCGGCPDGQSFVDAPGGGSCQPDAPPAPTCAAGQTVNSNNQCVGSGNAPTAGTGAPEVETPQVGTCDTSGNNCVHNDFWGQVASGSPQYMNCGGWECYYQPQDVTGVWYDPANGNEYLSVIPVYTGQPATTSETVGNAPPSDTPTPTTFNCPSGSSYDATTGFCTAGKTAGTPSTSSAPAAPPNPGVSTCPVGFSIDANGVCSGPPSSPTPGGTAVCPTGSTLGSNGVCSFVSKLSNGVPSSGSGSSGSGSGSSSGSGSGTASCGGPGQPECAVKLDETGTPSGADTLGGKIAAWDGLSPQGLGLPDFSYDNSKPGASVPSWFPQIIGGSDDCVTPDGIKNWQLMGQSMNIDVCPAWAPVKDGLRWFLYAITALFAFRRVQRLFD